MSCNRASAQYKWSEYSGKLTHTQHFAEDASPLGVHGIIGPQAWHRNGRTYVAYQGVKSAPHVACYDHEKKVWLKTVPVGVNPIGHRDSHGAPAMIVDKEGYIHIFYGSHAGKQLYAKSVRPDDHTEWIAMPHAARSMTYPMPTLLSDGTIVLIARAGFHKAPWIEKSTIDGGKTWQNARSILDFRPHGAYCSVTPGTDGKSIHMAFCLQEKLDLDRRAMRLVKSLKHVWDERNHSFYIFRDAEGVWRNIEGEKLPMPLSLKTAHEKCLVYRGDWPHHGNVTYIGVTPKNRPCLAWLDGELPKEREDWLIDRVQYTVKSAYYDGTNKKWQVSDITTTDNIFDSPSAIFPDDHGNVDVYLIAGGSFETDSKRGGDVQHWRSTEHGTNWKKVKDVHTFAHTGDLYVSPRPVVDAHPDGKIIFGQYHTGHRFSGTYNHRVYLYGENGFCTQRYTK